MGSNHVVYSVGSSLWLVVAASALAAAMFGVLMAAHYSYSAKKNNLSKWEDL